MGNQRDAAAAATTAAATTAAAVGANRPQYKKVTIGIMRG